MGKRSRKKKLAFGLLLCVFCIWIAASGCGKLFIENELPYESPSARGSPDPSPTQTTASCTLGTTWQTVDDFQTGSSQHASAQAIASDSSGNLYVAGKAQLSGINAWTVRKSADGGSTWTTSDSFTYPSGGLSVAQGVQVAADGSVFVTGYARDSGGNAHWIVRKSSNGGSTWSTVDDFQHVALNAYATQITTDSSGALYVAGYGTDVDNLQRWLIRKSTDAGVTWSTLVSHQPSSGATGVCGSAATDSTVGQSFVFPSSRVLLGGCAQTGGASRWLVRTGAADGSSWTDVDDYQLSNGQSANVSGAAKTDSGTLIVSGYASDGTANSWIVRSSQNDGSSWTTVDQFQYFAGKNATARAAGTDASQNLYVAGSGAASSDRLHWLVRKSTDSGSSWTSQDNYQYYASGDSEALGFGRDSAGNLFAMGYGYDSGGIKHWLVRKLPCE